MITAVRAMDAKVADRSVGFSEYENAIRPVEKLSRRKMGGDVANWYLANVDTRLEASLSLISSAFDCHGDKRLLSWRLRGLNVLSHGGCAAGGHQMVGARSRVALLELFASHIIASEFHPSYRNITPPRLAFCPPRYSWLSNSHDCSHSRNGCRGLEARARS